MNKSFFGALVGRYGNVSGTRSSRLDGKSVTRSPRNNGENSLQLAASGLQKARVDRQSLFPPKTASRWNFPTSARTARKASLEI